MNVVNRRRFLTGAALVVPGGLLAAGALRTTAQQGGEDARVPSAGAEPFLDGPVDHLLSAGLAAHAARRLSMAPTPDLANEIDAVGLEAWLDRQLQPGTIDESPVLKRIVDELATASMTHAEYAEAVVAERRAIRENPDIERMNVARDLLAETALTALLSPRHLQSLMTDLWSDHLNVHMAHDGGTRTTMPLYVREVLRPLALGRFADLLLASAQSPAMLLYLDNASSNLGEPNENYARELLELHTVGAANHSEEDVAGVARILTGWGINQRLLAFRFSPGNHHNGVATVLGKQFGGAGLDDGVALIEHLASRPETASNIARRIATRLVSDRPDEDFISRLAAIYLDSDTSIAAVVRAAVLSEEFAASAGAKLRRPFEYSLAAIGALGTSAESVAEVLVRSNNRDRRGAGSLQAAFQGLEMLGHVPYGWPAPNGYPDVAGPWVSAAAALGRWQVAADLAGATIDADADPEAVIDTLTDRLMIAPPTPSVRAGILASAAEAERPAVVAAALLLDHPAAHLR